MKDLLTLTKIKNGDVKAFEQVFRLYYMPLCMFAASITGRMDIAEEIVQELFYVFWKERERLQLFHTIKSYLYGAVRNQSLQYWEHQDVRNRYRDAILSHPDKDDTPDDPQEPDRIQGTGSSGKPDTRKASRTSSPHIPDASFRRKEICGNRIQPLPFSQNSRGRNDESTPNTTRRIRDLHEI